MPKVKRPHAALLASPGAGHLIPVLELGERMVTHHDFHVTIFIVASDDIHASTSLLKSPTQNHDLCIVTLPLVDISGLLEPNAHIMEKLLFLIRQSLPSLRSSIAAMKCRPTALVVDIFGIDALEIADEFGMLKYVFNTSTAWFLAVMLHSSRIGKNEILEEHVKTQKPLNVPGCKSLQFEDTFDALLNVDRLDKFQLMATKTTKADGVLINTWEDLESSTIEALRDENLWGKVAKVPIYPIGPLVKEDRNQALVEQVKNWLDKQPIESVIYISFGSWGTLSAKQITELAWGLEQGQQRFIWVIHPPSENASGAYFTIRKNEQDGTPDYLPEGFLTRTKDIGLVIPTWAPQAQILRHPSVGGFLSHCGWNSTLESISNGVSMIAWPLYAEQKMNSVLLTEELGIAVRPKVSPTDDVVGRDEITSMVKKIMVNDDKEGDAMRTKVKELKISGEKALKKGGSSYNSLSQIATECLQRLQA